MNREYETHEVLKLIGENPTWKFQTKFSDGIIWEAFSRSDNKGVRCIYGKGTKHEREDFLTSDSNTMTRKWKKVRVVDNSKFKGLHCCVGYGNSSGEIFVLNSNCERLFSTDNILMADKIIELIYRGVNSIS